MQFVMISPTNTDKLLDMSYATACRTWSTTMTNDAIMVICTMIRMLVGMKLRMSDTAKLDIVVTNITAAHITRVVDMLTVTASAEQMPNTCSAIGLLLNIGSTRTSLDFDIVISASGRRTQAFQVGAESGLASPEIDHILHLRDWSSWRPTTHPLRAPRIGA